MSQAPPAHLTDAVNDAKSKLMRADANGVSLHDHLSATLAKIITEDPDDALAMFEQISMNVKRQSVLPRKEYLQVRLGGGVRRGASTRVVRVGG